MAKAKGERAFVPEKKTGAKPILIGGTFTPTWHIPSCPCDGCVEHRNTFSQLVIPKNLAELVKFSDRPRPRAKRRRDCCRCRRHD